MTRAAIAILPSGDQQPTSAGGELVSALFVVTICLGLAMQWAMPAEFEERLILTAIGAWQACRACQAYQRL